MGIDLIESAQTAVPRWVSNHPVSRVQWVPAECVRANDYNPNSVATPEMELLRLSIEADGYTQPIVVWEAAQGVYEVVDGFHRHKVGKMLGLSHLPVVIVNNDRTDKSDRMASTIRHNRARGKHAVGQMSEIVMDLARRNWSDSKIAKELGMDADEVLRLKQIKGLEEMFADRDFSEAWEAI
ncbi:IbrB-like domain-containing protein [Pusillimonas noertemannii]|uniref:IbrB-like domain-containing protein n=1 Tax=Pusillimonas noertemannii TaxID=305977 RepID=UPI0033422364